MTLIEVLAAVVLLSIIAAGTLPMLRTIAAQSGAAAGPPAEPLEANTTAADLAAVADVVMARPAQLMPGGPVPGPGGVQLDWDRAIALGRLPLQANLPRPPLLARTLLPSNPKTARVWIVFEAGDHRVFRMRRGQFAGADGPRGPGDEAGPTEPAP